MCYKKLDFICISLPINPGHSIDLLFAPAQTRLKDVRVMMHLILMTFNMFLGWAVMLHFY